ncbi:MAG TPA: twin-arginine translocase TatA/TatE family subunit [Steroidobacteraceae bacterium]|nr:twin-arginine translocase TatA/TatE family subunit [Steroidobacteraceae bacterium]
MLSGLENPVHLLIVLLVILLLFGAKRLPEMGRSLGSGMREFKSGLLGAGLTQLDRAPEPSPTGDQHVLGTPTKASTRDA